MTQIILVETDKQLATVLRANLHKKFGWDVIHKENSSEALSILQILGDVELIITREMIGKDSTAQKICQYLIANKADFEKEIPVLIIGENKTEYRKASSIDSNVNWDQLINFAGSLLGIVPPPDIVSAPKMIIAKPAPAPEPVVVPTPEIAPVEVIEAAMVPEAEYVALSSKYFLNLYDIALPFETYTRTKKKDKGYEYAQKFKANEVLERAEIERMVMRGIAEFFIPVAQYDSALKFSQKSLLERVNKSEIQGLDRVQLASDVFDLNLEQIKNLAIDEFTMDLILANANSLRPIINSANVFALFNNGRKLKKLSYGFTHSFLTAILLTKIIPAFEWSTEELKEKILFLAYLHDLSLQSEKLIRAHHHFFQESKTLSQEESAIVFQHALTASGIALKFSTLSPEIAQMIKEHHGIKAGKGFSETLSIIISPLSMCFLTIEEFVTKYLDIKNEANADVTLDQVKVIFSEMEKKFNKMTYDQTLKMLRELYK